MQRYIIEDASKSPHEAIWASLAWLEERGGGTLMCDLKVNLQDALDVDDSQLGALEGWLSEKGIELTWERRGLPRGGNVVAAYTTRDTIEKLDKRNLDSLLVLGWSESDWRDWKEKTNPEHVELSE